MKKILTIFILFTIILTGCTKLENKRSENDFRQGEHDNRLYGWWTSMSYNDESHSYEKIGYLMYLDSTSFSVSHYQANTDDEWGIIDKTTWKTVGNNTLIQFTPFSSYMESLAGKKNDEIRYSFLESKDTIFIGFGTDLMFKRNIYVKTTKPHNIE